MKEKIKSIKGITLVALVVTIVVLLILASITMTLLMNGGLIDKTKNATAIYKQSEATENNGLNRLNDKVDIILNGETLQTLQEAKADDIKTTPTTENSKVVLSDGTIAVPQGFKLISGSAAKVSTGAVIEDAIGNQYVWIPVSDISNYIRKDFGVDDGAYSNYYENMPSNEQDSVTRYKGYYIGRYESGIDTLRTSASQQVVNSSMRIKNNMPPFFFVTRNQAIAVSESDDWKPNGKAYPTAKTKLCSSYAWDTALVFIGKTVTNYATNSVQDNFSTYLKNTGTPSSTAVCNIFDMGGNVYEWSTESNHTSYPCVSVGGVYYGSATARPAGSRSSNTSTYSCNVIGFRTILYL